MARILIWALAGLAVGIAGKGLITESDATGHSRFGLILSENESTGYSWLGATLHGCRIKGNISLNTGERIYHVPGQAYYAATTITPSDGERWFCTEADARAAGWRRARL